MDEQLTKTEMRNNFILHKIACKKANVRAMSFKQFVLKDIYQD